MSSISIAIGAIAAAANWITLSRRILTERRNDTLQLTCKALIVDDPGLISQIGSPGILVRVVNNGVRVAKIREVSIRVRGHGYLKRFDHGYEGALSYDPVDDPELQAEMLMVGLFHATKKSNENGWVLERDDVCDFVFPVGTAATNFFLDAKSDAISIVVTMFSGEELVVANGREFVGLLSPCFDRCVQMGWHCPRFSVNIVVHSKTYVSHPQPGTVNTRQIDMADDDSMMHLPISEPKVRWVKWPAPPRRRRRLDTNS